MARLTNNPIGTLTKIMNRDLKGDGKQGAKST